MEAASAFDAGVEDTGGDPFGADDVQGFAQAEADAFAEAGEGNGNGEAPVVDREGNPVAPEAEAQPEPEAEAQPEPDPTSAQPDTATLVGESTSSEAPGAVAGSEAGDGEGTAEAAPEPQPKKKGDTRRKYLVFAVDGPGRYAEVGWYEKGGEIVTKGTAGAKRQTVCLVHDTNEALAVGYAALGSPPNGCKLVAVSASYFKPKDVKPKPVSPSKTPLSIT